MDVGVNLNPRHVARCHKVGGAPERPVRLGRRLADSSLAGGASE